MNSRLRRTLAALALAAAAVTGTTIADEVLAPQGDTTWGAPDTPADTTWDTPTTDTGTTGDTAPDAAAPLDTTWKQPAR